MTIFQHPLWGFEFTYPADWVHSTVGDVEGFAEVAAALEPGYSGEKSGHLLVRPEWNATLQAVEPLWGRHMGVTAGLIGAKRVGSAAWQMGGAVGLEAEIALPKVSSLRLWSGILARDFLVLHFMVTHPKDDRARFEPLVTRLIASLRFVPAVTGLAVEMLGLPLPPGYVPMDPRQVIPDIADVAPWSAYDGESPVGALQAFYLREVAAHGWTVDEFMPFPADTGLGFARFKLHMGEAAVMVGLMPVGAERVTVASPAKIVVKQVDSN
jgi:hypothetical protein